MSSSPTGRNSNPNNLMRALAAVAAVRLDEGRITPFEDILGLETNVIADSA